MQLSCMESSSGLTAQPLFLWITQANFDNFSKKNVMLWYIIDVQFITTLKNMLGDELGTEFCWPKEKKSKYRIAFYSISEVPFPKDMKNLCNPRKRSIIGVQSGLLYIYSSSKLNFLHNVEMADIGSKNAHLFFFWPAAFVILFLVSSY